MLTFSACNNSSSSNTSTGFISTPENTTDSVTFMTGQSFTINPALSFNAALTDDTTTETPTTKYAVITVKGDKIGISAAEYNKQGKLLYKVLMMFTETNNDAALPAAGASSTIPLSAGTITAYITKAAGRAPSVYSLAAQTNSLTITNNTSGTNTVYTLSLTTKTFTLANLVTATDTEVVTFTTDITAAGYTL